MWLRMNSCRICLATTQWMCRLKGARKPCVGIAQQGAALMAPGKHLLKLFNGGDDRGRGAAKKKGAEIAQRLWRPREAKRKKCRNCATALATPDRAHRRFSPNSSLPARPNKAKGGHIQTSNCAEGYGDQGREKKKCGDQGESNKLFNACGDEGSRKTE